MSSGGLAARVLARSCLLLLGYFLTPVIGDLRDIQDSALTLGDLRKFW